MRSIKIGNAKATFSDEAEWSSSDALFLELLNDTTELVSDDISPADGDPVAVLFYRVVDALKIRRNVTDTTEAFRTVEVS